MFWDTRSGKSPVLKGLNIHKDDINTVDWNKIDQNYVVTGSSDCKACLIDIRKLTSSTDNNSSKAIVRELVGHTNSINVVRFSPFSSDYIATSGECLIIWDLKN